MEHETKLPSKPGKPEKLLLWGQWWMKVIKQAKEHRAYGKMLRSSKFQNSVGGSQVMLQIRFNCQSVQPWATGLTLAQRSCCGLGGFEELLLTIRLKGKLRSNEWPLPTLGRCWYPWFWAVGGGWGCLSAMKKQGLVGLMKLGSLIATISEL